MARKKKERCSDPGRLQYWTELLSDCMRYNDPSPDGHLFGYLNDTYTPSEIEQLKIACEQYGLSLVIERQGGSIYGPRI